MYLRIYYYNETNPGGFSQPYSGVAAKIWQGMNEAYAKQPSSFYVDFGWREWIPSFPEIQQTGVKNGGVVIYDWDRQTALLVLSPSAVTSSNIKEKLLLLYKVEYDGQGGYINADGSEWGFGNGQGNGDGCVFANLPIIGGSLSWMCELDKYLWIGATVFGAVKTVDAQKPSQQLVWGALTTVAAYQTAKRVKNDVPWWVYATLGGYTGFKFKDSLPGGNLNKIDKANTATYAYGLGTAYLAYRAQQSYKANAGNNSITGRRRRVARKAIV